MVRTTAINLQYLTDRFTRSSSIILVTPRDPNDRCLVDNISFIYIYWPDIDERCMVGITHSDLDSLDMDTVLTAIESSGTHMTYVMDVANVLNITYTDKIVNVLYYLWFVKHVTIPSEYYNTFSFEIVRQWYTGFKYVEDIVPISLYTEWCRKISDWIDMYTDKIVDTDDPFFKLYVSKYHKVIKKLEVDGIPVDPALCSKYYNVTVNSDHIHPYYNVRTITGRPSAKFENIHFNSLNKVDGTRSIILSGNDDGILVEFDYDAYHIHLIANVIGYKFPTTGNIHEYLGRLYFGSAELSAEQYEQSKKITFTQMYSDVPDTYSYIDFFKVLTSYKCDMWDDFQQLGYVRTKGGRYFRKSDYPDITVGKLFAYIQQATETEENIIMLDKIQEYLLGRNSKLIMYFYDSFLIDFSKQDGEYTLMDIYNILTSTGYPISVKVGQNYGEMSELETTSIMHFCT